VLGSRLGATEGAFEVLGWWLGLSEGDWDMLGRKLGESNGDRFGSISEGLLDAVGSSLSKSEGRAAMLGSRLGATEGACVMLGWRVWLAEGTCDILGSDSGECDGDRRNALGSSRSDSDGREEMLGSRLGITEGAFEILSWRVGLVEDACAKVGSGSGEYDGDRRSALGSSRSNLDGREEMLGPRLGDILGNINGSSETLGGRVGLVGGAWNMLGSELGECDGDSTSEGKWEALGSSLSESEGEKEELGSLLDAVGNNDVLCGVIVWLDGYTDKEGNWDGVDETLGLELVRDATSMLGAWEKLWVTKVVSVPDEKREGTSVSGHLLGVLDVVPTPFTPVRVENPDTLRSIEAYSAEEIALSIASIRSSSFLRLRTDLSIKTSNTRTTLFGDRFRRKDCWTKRGSCDVTLICKITADICDVVNTLLTKFSVNDIHLVNNSVFNAGSP
jgi:hypothetical protein